MNTSTRPPTNVVSHDLLLTHRLALRPLRKGDIDALHALFADPGVRRQLGLRRVPRWREVAALVARSLAQRRAHGGGLWTLAESVCSPRLAGIVGLWEFREQVQAPHELVLAVAGEAPDGVIAQEAAQAMVDYAGSVLRWPCLYASLDAALLRRLGFAECSGKDAPRRVFRIDLDEARMPAPLRHAVGW